MTTLPISSTFNSSALGVSVPGVPATTPILGQVNFKANADAGGDIPQSTYRLLGGRVDFNPTGNTQMFFRYGQEQENQFPGTAFYSPYPQYDVGGTVYNRSGLFSLSHTFSPSLFSATKLSANRLTTQNSYDTSLQNTPGLMFGGASANGLQVSFPGLVQLHGIRSGGLPYGGPQNTAQTKRTCRG